MSHNPISWSRPRCDTWFIYLALLTASFAGQVSCAELVTDLADVARAYNSFEQAYAQTKNLDDARISALHRGMDTAAGMYFRRDYASAVQRLHELLIDVTYGKGVPETYNAIAALGVASDSVELVRDQSPASRLWLRSLYDPSVEHPVTLNLILEFVPRFDGQPLRTSVEVTFEQRKTITLELATGPMLRAGEATYDCYLVGGDGFRWNAGSLTVLTTSRNSTARALMEELEEAAEPRPLVGEKESNVENARLSRDTAIGMCRGRIEILANNSMEARITRWVLDPLLLRQSLVAEIRELRAGRNPYAHLRGDNWLPIAMPTDPVPCRIYIPATVDVAKAIGGTDRDQASPSLPPPLLVALHGAGGNEHMFFEGLGGGQIKSLADELGYIVVAPSTTPILMQPLQFPVFLDRLAEVVPFDREEVYLIGHSMGAMAAMQLSALHPKRFRRTCAIAGGPQIALLAEQLPPTRVYAAEKDFLIPLESLRKPAQSLADRKLPVTFHKVKNAGHVLVVTTILDEAVRWMLEESRAESQESRAESQESSTESTEH